MAKYTGYPHDDYYKEYRNLGGKKMRDEYDKMVDIFHDHTMDLYIHGDTTKYETRDEAWNGCQKALQINNKEMNRLFESINNITAYT